MNSDFFTIITSRLVTVLVDETAAAMEVAMEEEDVLERAYNFFHNGEEVIEASEEKETISGGI